MFLPLFKLFFFHFIDLTEDLLLFINSKTQTEYFVLDTTKHLKTSL